LKYLILILLLVGCTTAQSPTLETQNNQYSYPIEEAYADEGWTRLERTISTGEAITFLVPSIWLPTEMSDIGNINVSIDRDLNSSTITISQVN